MSASTLSGTPPAAAGSIRKPLVITMVLAVLLPAILGNVVIAFFGFQSVEARAAGQLNDVIEFRTGQLNTWLIEMQTDLDLVSSDVEAQGYVLRILPGSRFQSLASDAASRLQATLKQLMQHSGLFNTVYITDTTGTLLLSTEMTFSDIQAILNSQVDPVTLYDGQIDYAQAANGPVVLPLHYLEDQGRAELVVFQPLRDPVGNTIALIGGSANLENLNFLMTQRAGLGQGSETYLVDSQNRLVSASLFSEMYPVGETRIDTTPFEKDALASPSDIPDADSIPAVTYSNYRDEMVIGVPVAVPQLGVTLVAEVDQAATMSLITSAVLTNFVVALVCSMVMGALGLWIINRQVIRPLSRLTSTAATITNGNLHVTVPANRNDEFGQLAQSFNTMTAHLRSLIESERQAKQRLESIVAEYVTFVRRIANGDLTSRLALTEADNQDSAAEDLYILGSNLNEMVEGLSEMASQVRHAVETIVSTASEIQVATVQQNATVLEQDSAVTQTVATVEEVRTTVQQTAERARAVASVSQQSVTVSRNGQQAVADSASGMHMIQQRVESIAETILMLSERTQQIGEIIDTVNALADQSKLLALNASIEAARAGEEGRGFAVVAMEVRQLAEQSREATSRVRGILSEIQQATNTAVMVTEEGSKGAEQGISLVERTGAVIRELSATIEDAAQTAMQIAASTHQQANGMEQLAAAILQIKAASEQTAAGTRQTEISIHNLIEMADQLEQAAARYQLAEKKLPDQEINPHAAQA